MRTYLAKIEKPMLKISFDEMAENPRKYSDNIGYFITTERNYISPDNNKTLIGIVKEASEISSNLEEHIKEVCSSIKENLNEDVLYIKPITRFEHGNVEYLLGNYSGWDYSLCGFYIVTNKTLGYSVVKLADIEKTIKAELKDYNQWANGEIYSFTLYDEDGEVVDSVCGFYDINDIHEHLPAEWQNENLQDYLVS